LNAHRLLAFLLVLTFSSLVMAPAAPAQAVRVIVDGDEVAFDQPPIIMGSRVMVPLRGIFEKMGATVDWDARTRTVEAARGNTLVVLKIGSRIARVNDRPVTLDVPAMVVRSRTLVPLRFISESLGARVEWREESRTVLISSPGQPAAQPPPPPSGQAATLKGVVMSVSPQADPARFVVEVGNAAHTVRVNNDTAISRVEASSGSGGSVSLRALRPGDDAEVTLQGNTATRVRASFLMTRGKIEAIARNSRTLVLTDGRAIRYVDNVVVEINGQPAAGLLDAVKVGQNVALRLNPTTKEAWEINILQ
jgi:hypothetical protein